MSTKGAKTKAATADTAESDAELAAGATETIDTDAEVGDEAPAKRGRGDGDQPEARRQPTLRGDDRRNAIVASYRETRNADAADADENNKEIAELMRSGGVPAEMAEHEDVEDEEQPKKAAAKKDDEADEDEETVEAEEGAEEEAATDADEEEQPKAKRKLKVRGKDVELSEEEIEQAAQKFLAGDSYLDEARDTLDRVKALRTETETMRTAAGKHPAKTAAQDGDAAEGEGDGEHPADDPLRSVIEKVQLGDPGEAAQALGAYIQEQIDVGAVKKTKETVDADRIEAATRRSNKALSDFRSKNKEIANDAMASAAIEAGIYDLQRQDILDLGVDPDKIPTDHASLARWHLWYRAQGSDVRDPETMLNQSRDKFLAWKNGEGAGPAQAEKGEKSKQPTIPAKKVEVKVDRAKRREVIQQQPTRTSVPRADAAARPAPVRDRSEVVQDMIKHRRGLRGMAVG